jgi:hypothetical protein
MKAGQRGQLGLYIMPEELYSLPPANKYPDELAFCLLLSTPLSPTALYTRHMRAYDWPHSSTCYDPVECLQAWPGGPPLTFLPGVIESCQTRLEV